VALGKRLGRRVGTRTPIHHWGLYSDLPASPDYIGCSSCSVSTEPDRKDRAELKQASAKVSAQAAVKLAMELVAGLAEERSPLRSRS
jgi:hypothetical protein